MIQNEQERKIVEEQLRELEKRLEKVRSVSLIPTRNTLAPVSKK